MRNRAALSELSTEELRTMAAGYRGMASQIRAKGIAESFLLIAGGIEKLAKEREPADDTDRPSQIAPTAARDQARANGMAAASSFARLNRNRQC